MARDGIQRDVRVEADDAGSEPRGFARRDAAIRPVRLHSR